MIIEVLNELLSGEIWGKGKEFVNIYGEKAYTILKKGIQDFNFYDNGQTVLVYDGRKLLYDCNYEEINGRKRLTTCYCREGLFCNMQN